MKFLVIVLLGLAVGAVAYFLSRRSTTKVIAANPVSTPTQCPVTSSVSEIKQEIKDELNVSKGTEKK